ncbi:MAG: hypothetical protein SGPRY_014972, partial [Prymnesium sp.]
MVEWITSVVCDDVVSQLGVHGAKPIYIGEEVAFSHISAIGGLDILVTGGPGADSFFLRSTTQVDELLRWLMEQHVAGVTVPGGKLPSHRGQMQSFKGQPSILKPKPEARSVIPDGSNSSTSRRCDTPSHHTSSSPHHSSSHTSLHHKIVEHAKQPLSSPLSNPGSME